MRIGIDIDNVLAEFEAAFRGWINRHAGLGLKRSDITSFLFADCCGLSHEEVAELFEGFVEAGRLRSLALIPHARAALRALSAHSELCLVTARPPRGRIVEDTHYWLERKGLPHAGLLWAERKREVADGFGLFVEDNMDQARQLAEAGVRVLLLDYPWNRALEPHPRIERVASWREALRVMSDE